MNSVLKGLNLFWFFFHSVRRNLIWLSCLFRFEYGDPTFIKLTSAMDEAMKQNTFFVPINFFPFLRFFLIPGKVSSGLAVIAHPSPLFLNCVCLAFVFLVLILILKIKHVQNIKHDYFKLIKEQLRTNVQT